MASERSVKVQSAKPPVCVDKSAVGIQQHSTPLAETMGKATVRITPRSSRLCHGHSFSNASDTMAPLLVLLLRA